MLKLTSVLLTDFFDKLTFNAQCLLGIVLARPLEEKDFTSLDGSEAHGAVKSVYLLLTHEEQKEILRAVLSSKPLFDSIVERMVELETNIVTWDKDMSISNEKLNDMINRDTYAAFNYSLKQISTAIVKTSPTLFQKLVVIALQTGFDADTICNRLAKQYRESEKQAKQFMDDLNKLFPPPPNKELPPLDDPEDDEGKY